MKWTTRIQLGSTTYFIMMAGAAAICLYYAAVLMATAGFSYHVLLQIFLALNALYMIYRKIFSGEPGFSLEIFFIVMGAIVVLVLSVTGAASWHYYRKIGYTIRSEYIGLLILSSIYFAALGWQVLVSFVRSRRVTRRGDDFEL